MRVLHIVYDLIRGGTEGQCARTALGLARRGLPCRVAVFHRRGYFLEEVEEVCGPVYEIGIRRMVSVSTVHEVRRLAHYIKAERFDVVHGWDMDACLFGFIAARMARVPFISSRRNLAEAMPRYKRVWLRWVDRHSSAVVANAEAIRRSLLGGVDARKVHVIGNVVDMRREKPESGRDRGAKDVVLAMVCRLEPEKDVATAIRAIESLVKGGYAVRLLIAGDGSERARLEDEAVARGVKDRVAFLGQVEDVSSILCVADIGLLTPAGNEGLSNSILEYMAAGLPTVATDCGGNRELLADSGSGLIVPVGDSCALAEAIRRLIESPSSAYDLGCRAKEKVLRDHSPSSILHRFEAFYLGVMNQSTKHQLATINAKS